MAKRKPQRTGGADVSNATESAARPADQTAPLAIGFTPKDLCIAMDRHCSKCGNKGHLDTSRYCKARDVGDQHGGEKGQSIINGNPTTHAAEDSTDKEEYADDSSNEWDSEEEEDLYADVLVLDKGDHGQDKRPSTYG